MSADCLFCKLRDKEISADILREDEDVIIFRDIAPKAPTHVLLIPKMHVTSIITVDESTKDVPGMLIWKAKEFAEEKGLTGYKLTFHVGREGGQVIDHLHLHLMSERELKG